MAEWKREHPQKKIDDLGFYMVGEVYGYGISGGRAFDYGDRKVDFFDFGYERLINFEFKYDAKHDYEAIFSKYSDLLHAENMSDQGVLNYLTSHDDGSPFDPERKNAYDVATKLLLCPGAAQIYYGDELARPLIIKDAEGDANLRSNMNWEDLAKLETKALLHHWQKVGRFRSKHQAVGAGTHKELQAEPYIFKRFLPGVGGSSVVVGLGLSKGNKEILVGDAFEEGSIVKDYYSGQEVTVKSGSAIISSPHDIVLLGKIE